MRFCAVVPTHDHHRDLPRVVAALRARNVPVFVVDDGSGPETNAVVAGLHAPENGVTGVHLPVNRGKGGAVMVGLDLAANQGFTHALQVDADGQHDLDQINALIAASRRQPNAIVSGCPLYDDSIPKGRKMGRWVTHVWVWIETLSLAIRDSMCGFRSYPIAATLAVWREEGAGRKMDFDTEIMVRLVWRGAPCVHVPIKVVYPEGNTSNFRLWADNVLISWMHTRLVLGMLLRLPRFLSRGCRWGRKVAGESSHWADMGERGRYWGIRFLGLTYRLAGRRVCLAVMAPIILYFFLTGRKARGASLEFLGKVARIRGDRAPGWWDSYRHFLSFGEAALDKIAAWCGELKTDHVDLPHGASDLYDFIPKDEALILFVSHYGNIEVIRALASRKGNVRVTVLMHQAHAANFARLLKDLAPDSQMDVIEVTDIGPDTAMLLSEKVSRGEWVVITGDRIAHGARNKCVRIPFLGEPASFPQGPYILAHLMQCPVYMAAAWRVGDRFELACEKLADQITLPRGDRDGVLAAHAQTYVAWLEQRVIAHPRQWFNFYPYWSKPDDSPSSR
ncbi:MAG: glycosyltransferase family 2 protein [Rhodospirillum sp.]|nr:glycosyltransferase family 2 protein [Rhodospirillum sp.]MCF8490841.1 glycosyltransferase family 2 protein [Rhodospirillum sp.]MCF8501400.1 glycosyltransferase family 2 protein [Rhodospirillum sp.]